MDPFPLKDRVALITGASKNIGRAIARQFALAGAHVVITGRDRPRLEEVATELRDLVAGCRVLPISGDASDESDLDVLSAAALAEFGAVDIVVNNALFSAETTVPILQTSEELWVRGMRGYVLGPLRLLRALYPAMVERGQGAVVNVLATSAFAPLPGRGAYGVMKSAMWTMTRYLAMELAPIVRVNAVCPGTTSENGQARADMDWLISSVPLARMGRAEELAKAALFLGSEASSYTTGQVMFCDGGRAQLGGGYQVY